MAHHHRYVQGVDPAWQTCDNARYSRCDAPMRRVEEKPATEQRDQGMAAAAAHLDAWWATTIMAAIRECGRAFPEFTTDEVWRYIGERVGPGPEQMKGFEPRSMGPLMIQAQRLHIVEPTERFENSTRGKAHAGPKRVWRSLLWQS